MGPRRCANETAGVAALQNELSRASDEYNNAMIMSQRPDPTPEAKRQIKEQLSALNNKLVQVKKNLPLSKKPYIRCYRKLVPATRRDPTEIKYAAGRKLTAQTIFTLNGLKVD